MIEPALPAEDLERVLAWCADDWASLRGARILVTGGTGFFGRWLLSALALAEERHRLGLAIQILTRDPVRARQQLGQVAEKDCVELVAGSVRSLRPSGRPCTHIVHMAAEVSASFHADRPLDKVDDILDGTRRVLESAIEGGASRMLFVSTGAVYGRQSPACARVPEDSSGGPDPLLAISAYAEAKRMAEYFCATVARSHGIAIPIARCWAFIGPGLALDAHFAVGNFIRDALAGGPVIVLGDGTAVRSYLYAADLAAWLLRILLRGASARAYNVGSEHAVSIAELAHAVAAEVSPRSRVEIREKARTGGVHDRYVPDVGRARSELGLEAWTPLADAIGKTIAWHRRGGMVAGQPPGQER